MIIIVKWILVIRVFFALFFRICDIIGIVLCGGSNLVMQKSDFREKQKIKLDAVLKEINGFTYQKMRAMKSMILLLKMHVWKEKDYLK